MVNNGISCFAEGTEYLVKLCGQNRWPHTSHDFKYTVVGSII